MLRTQIEESFVLEYLRCHTLQRFSRSTFRIQCMEQEFYLFRWRLLQAQFKDSLLFQIDYVLETRTVVGVFRVLGKKVSDDQSFPMATCIMMMAVRISIAAVFKAIL